jgi:ABC-type proline/glycine betaine transport system substrate-binding protein
MNILLSAPRVAFMAMALGSLGITATLAQTTTAPTTTTPATSTPTCTAGNWHHHHHNSVLSASEKAQLKAARHQALASNGTLKTQKESLKQQFEALKTQGDSATKEQWHALHQQARDYHQQLKAAELLIDPSLAPIFAKLEAAHKGAHHSST